MIYSSCSETCKNGLRGCQAYPCCFPLYTRPSSNFFSDCRTGVSTRENGDSDDLCCFFLSLLGRWGQYLTCKRCRMFQCELGAAQLSAACPQHRKGLVSQGRVSAPFLAVMCLYEQVACLTGGKRQQKTVVEYAFL